MPRYVDAEYVLNALNVFRDTEHGDKHFLNGIATAKEIVENAPVADVVSFKAYENLVWDCDTATAQLAEYGIGLGEKKRDMQEVVKCKECKYLSFSDCYGECEKAILGIVSLDDCCSRGERKNK